ncbi:uncharacterized protein M421DRAFT_76853 [Didymella exigua CBS 183.55]|uniref:Uncharacterized protein n=1 Tax=Didymella exigua CBS 183.55 TaxID=1150837 RepID=A0A6A5R851_9PLEO|nr:uncharacterized protein M421DRAFT_76853 [Didymella exigua CBS 183.55]KAF1922896.1 hypothetical protein M421DRAFT_76853 [Didymella exigua CBS 183.55]
MQSPQPQTGSQEPKLERSITLRFVGDWGQANFHRICSTLAQEFCDRAGPRSRVAIWNIRHGGFECLTEVEDGEVDLAIATPVDLIAQATQTHSPDTPSARLYPRQLPNLRALAVLPQNDSMVLAIHPKFGISSFEELRQKKPALRIATSRNDGTSFIGHVAAQYMEAHGISEETLHSWGGSYKLDYRPEQSLFAAQAGEVDAVLQEAIMTPWWRDVIEQNGFVPLAVEEEALATLKETVGLGSNSLPAGYWAPLKRDLPTLSFQDFVVLVHNDMPDDVAHLLAWCLVEQRMTFEKPYHHMPPHRSPLTYPLDPAKMAASPIPLHPGAKRFYQSAGYL